MVKVFYAGDSTVTYNKIDSYPQTGLSQGLLRYLKDEVWMRPFGFNGRSSKSFIDEGHLAEINAEISEGDILLIQFGHNDEKDDAARHTDPASSYQEKLLEIAEVARRHGAHPVFISSLARRLFDEESGAFRAGSHGAYPNAMRALAEREGIAFIDFCAITERYLMQVGDIASRPWFVYPKDNTHLSPVGAVVFAGFLCDALSALGAPYSDLFVSRKKLVENVGLDVS